MKLRIGGGEIDQVIRVRKSGMEFRALGVIEERRDFPTLQGPREPLHIVLHENLHRRAFDRTRAFDGHVRAAARSTCGRREELRIAECRLWNQSGRVRGCFASSVSSELEFGSLFCASRKGDSLLSEIRSPQSEIVRIASGASSASRGCLRLCIRTVCRRASARCRDRARRFGHRNRAYLREIGCRRARPCQKVCLKL